MMVHNPNLNTMKRANYTQFENIKNQVSFKQKIRELRNASKDDLFRDDLNEISEDFRIVDLKGLECIS